VAGSFGWLVAVSRNSGVQLAGVTEKLNGVTDGVGES